MTSRRKSSEDGSRRIGDSLEFRIGDKVLVFDGWDNKPGRITKILYRGSKKWFETNVLDPFSPGTNYISATYNEMKIRPLPPGYKPVTRHNRGLMVRQSRHLSRSRQRIQPQKDLSVAMVFDPKERKSGADGRLSTFESTILSLLNTSGIKAALDFARTSGMGTREALKVIQTCQALMASKGNNSIPNPHKTKKTWTFQSHAHKCTFPLCTEAHSTTYSLTGGKCDHWLCLEHISGVLKCRVDTLSANPNPTCGSKCWDCKVKISQKTIRVAVAFEILTERYGEVARREWKKHELRGRGRMMIECPRCQFEESKSLPPSRRHASPVPKSAKTWFGGKGKVDTKWECGRCSLHYCTDCAVSYHEGKTCKQYQQQKQGTDVDTRIMVEKCHPCPVCKIRVYRDEGCNHMSHKCKYATVHWCAICGEHLRNAQESMVSKMNHFPRGVSEPCVFASKEKRRLYEIRKQATQDSEVLLQDRKISQDSGLPRDPFENILPYPQPEPEETKQSTNNRSFPDNPFEEKLNNFQNIPYPPNPFEEFLPTAQPTPREAKRSRHYESFSHDPFEGFLSTPQPKPKPKRKETQRNRNYRSFSHDPFEDFLPPPQHQPTHSEAKRSHYRSFSHDPFEDFLPTPQSQPTHSEAKRSHNRSFSRDAFEDFQPTPQNHALFQDIFNDFRSLSHSKAKETKRSRKRSVSNHQTDTNLLDLLFNSDQAK
ncbi:hypothetical protein AAMO2058_000818400 [Amorphochlora amoebiformis]